MRAPGRKRTNVDRDLKPAPSTGLNCRWHRQCAFALPGLDQTSQTRALGQQPRGVHLKLRECATKEEHADAAINARHPNLLISEVLDPTWRHVFDQFEESFKLRGPDATWTRALAHRERMMTWVRQLAVELERGRRSIDAPAVW